MIFGEPTNNEIITGHKGLLDYEITFIGKKAHSSMTNKGISANMNAVKFLWELDNYYNEEIKKEENQNFEIPFTTMNVGIINGGSGKNSVSAFCKVTIDFRIIDSNHINKIETIINKLIKKYQAKKKLIDKIEPFEDTIHFLEKTKTINYLTEASMVPDAKRLILGTGPVTAHEVD